jgi:outer membrane protein TolC
MSRLQFALLLVAALGGPVWAEAPATPAHLPSTAQAVAAIDADPLVRRARSAAGAAGHGVAAGIARGQEWSLRLQGQQRRFRDGAATSNEWSSQLERPLRLNGKAGIDAELQAVEAHIGRARIGEARHESARALADLWGQVLLARRLQQLAGEQVGLADEQRQAVQRRLRAGDASQLELNLAEAEWREVQREASQAEQALRLAEAALRSRFELAPPATLSQPTSPAVALPRESWRQRVLDEADPIRAAEGEWQRSQLQARRARADRVPDPTVGVYLAQEGRGNERIVGLSLSVPLGRTGRSERVAQTEAEAGAAAAWRDQVAREIGLEADQTHLQLEGAIRRQAMAAEAARLAAANARLTLRAYALGESDLQTLLQARRQAGLAARSEAEAQGEALRWEARQWVDAHEVWNLAED